MHVVCSLTSARALASRPSFIPKGRPRGSKAVGLLYQRKVAEALASVCPEGLQVGPWYEYRDEGKFGTGFCQPDFVVHRKWLGDYVVIECKLSWTPVALEQLASLYIPVLHRVYQVPVYGMVVTKYLNPGAPKPQESFKEALCMAGPGYVPLWHYVGIGPA